jgi:glycosyltransferase involved in cell wall biosynthesis
MRVLFVDGTAAFSPSRLATKATGGICTSLTKIPRYLASRGHEVYVVSVYEEEALINNVWYTRDKERIAKPDVVVFNRNTITRQTASCFPDSRIVFWAHDIVDPRYFEDDGFTKADYVVALSDYCKESYSDFYGIAPEKFVVIPNGIDPSVFYPGTQPRNKNLWICASAPIKGLQPIDYWYENMKRHNPDVELRLYCSSSLHDLPEEQKFAQMLQKLKDKGIKVLDPIPQRELAEVFREAYALLMPNSYPEICSNVLLQAQACGLPVIASNIGSASEFIQHDYSGLLTTTTPPDIFWWWFEFTRLSVRLYFNEAQHRFISKHAPLNVPTWDYIGARWNEFLLDAMEEAA